MNNLKPLLALLFLLIGQTLFAQDNILVEPEIGYTKHHITSKSIPQKMGTPGASCLVKTSTKLAKKLKKIKLKSSAPGHSNLARGRYLRSNAIKNQRELDL